MTIITEGKTYRVIANDSYHEFPIGELVRCTESWDESSGLFEYLDHSDVWACNVSELEAVDNA